jgi:hypothetical protein
VRGSRKPTERHSRTKSSTYSAPPRHSPSSTGCVRTCAGREGWKGMTRTTPNSLPTSCGCRQPQPPHQPSIAPPNLKRRHHALPPPRVAGVGRSTRLRRTSRRRGPARGTPRAARWPCQGTG